MIWYQSQAPVPNPFLIQTLATTTTSTSESTLDYAQSLIPIFSHKGYELCSMQMKIVFISQDLWDLVEEWYNEPASMEELTTTWMVANKGIILNKIYFMK